jgi:hypothetical protein
VKTLSELPRISFNGNYYFVDEKLSEIRNVKNPHDGFSFEEYCKLRSDAEFLRYPEKPGCGHCKLKRICVL